MSAKRTKYIDKACQQCRRRKAKCDGQRPVCGRCRRLDDEECSYSTNKDARKAASRSYVQSLEHRIKVLEDLLEKRCSTCKAQDLDDFGDMMSWNAEHESSSAHGDMANDEEDDLSIGLGHLTLDLETHELQQYGPTSALQHLPAELEDLSRGVSTSGGILSPQFNPWTRRLEQAPHNIDLSLVDWRRHLPPLDEFDVELHDQLISLFFSCFHFYGIVDQAAFSRDMFECLADPMLLPSLPPPRSRTSYYSPVLHNAILAVACELSDDPRAGNKEVGATLLRASQHELFVEGDRPTLSTVQGKHGLGYFYTGIAIRMCHTLGLNLDCSAYVQKGVLTDADRRARDRTLWVCYLYDKLWSSYIGHEPSLLGRRIRVKLPDIDEAGASDWHSTTFHWTVRLSTIQEEIMAAVYGARARAIYSATTANKVSAAGLRLDEWLEGLPSPLRILPQTLDPGGPHILTLNIYYHFLVILLYRPFYQRQGTLSDGVINQTAIRRCNSASARITSLLETFDRSPGLRLGPVVLVQIACMACTTHLLAFVHAQRAKQPSTAAAAQQAAVRCLNLLKKIGAPYRASTQHADMLEKMMQECGAAVPGQNAPHGRSESTFENASLDSAADRFGAGLEATWERLDLDFGAGDLFDTQTQTASQINTDWAERSLPSGGVVALDDRSFSFSPSYVFSNQWTMEQLLQQNMQ